MKTKIGLLLFALMVLSPFALLASRADAQRSLPPNRPEQGLLYDGLEAGNDGPCKGAFQVRSSVGDRITCSHGPDAAAATMPMGNTAAPLVMAPAPVVCDGDGTSGKRVQVIYAHAATVADQFATYQASFQQWAADADSDFNVSAQQSGDTRHVRYVTDAGCLPVVLDVTLSATGAGDFSSMISELYNKGYNRTDRRYMVFMDAHVYCGISDVEYDDQPGAANINNSGPEYARIDGGCWSGVIAAHELMHTLGSVQLSAPHSDGNWHCTEGYDNMCDHSGHAVTPVCANTAGDSLFDCSRDDYFNPRPAAGSYLATHWNTANNQFLIGAGAAATATPSATATKVPTASPTATKAATATATPRATPPATATATPPAGAPVPSVNSLSTGKLNANGSFYPTTRFSSTDTVTARAHVVDQNGRNLGGASVTLAFKDPSGATQCTVTAVSDASGIAQASCATPNAPHGSWLVHLVSVAMSPTGAPTSGMVGDFRYSVR